MANAVITNIQGYSIHDGPGIRTVVFIKGCPLSCKWCANPENLKPMYEVGWLENLCKHCGRCAKKCSVGAIVPDETRRIDRVKCTNCGDCVSACFYDALVGYGEEKSSEEVFAKVRRDKMFYETSGGGVTVSGGEPLTRSEFVAELFEMCHKDDIATCVETCGCVPKENMERVLPHTDLFYFDLKIMDPVLHQQYTGMGNELILDNARYLAAEGANILFRQPIIPTVNNTEENVRATAEFIRSLGREDIAIQLMPYHRMGSAKYAALERPYELEGLQIMPMEEVEALCEMYQKLGVSCSVSK